MKQLGTTGKLEGVVSASAPRLLNINTTHVYVPQGSVPSGAR